MPEFSQMMLDIFNKRDPGAVLWQPRLEYWYEVNKLRKTLPHHLAEASLQQVYDYCHASIRYFSFPLRQRFKSIQAVTTWDDERTRRVTYETHHGKLTEALRYDEWMISSYNCEYLLKTPDDVRLYNDFLDDEEWYWDQEIYKRNLTWAGKRGVPTFYFRRSPIQGLFIEKMGFERTIFMLMDYPDIVLQYIERATEADDAMYQVICNCPVEIVNFGENIDAHMDPPPIWRKYLLPYYERRVAQLRAAGKKTFIHIDGAMKPLISLIRASPFDGIEACTPLPQGDVTLEEIQVALGEKVFLDGIPAVYFLPTFSIQTLLDCAKEVVERFHPRLALGASDEVPPDSDIERVRLVGEFIQDLGSREPYDGIKFDF